MEKGTKISKVNWYGFDHEAVAKKFTGNLKFLNTFCVNGEYEPVAVYLSQDWLVPAKRKKMRKDFKKYVLLQTRTGLDGRLSALIRGMDQRKINKFRYQEAVHCHECGDIVYSVMRHDMRPCQCGAISVDGGKEYTKISFKDRNKLSVITVDLLTDKVFVEGLTKRKPKKRK